MLAVPSPTEPVALALLFLIGLPAGLVTAYFARGRLLTVLPPSRARGQVALALAAALLVGVAGAPPMAWRIVEDVRYTSSLPEHTAERIGAAENYVDGTIFDVLEARIPAGDSYYVHAARTVDNARARAAFETWALTVLLPRQAVSSPKRATWVVTWGVVPDELGVPVEDVEVVGRPGGGFPPAYLARVA